MRLYYILLLVVLPPVVVFRSFFFSSFLSSVRWPRCSSASAASFNEENEDDRCFNAPAVAQAPCN